MQFDSISHLLPRPVLAGLGLSLTLILTGCDVPGMGNAAKAQADKADGKAVGSACRHSVRSIEDCYQNNPKASKAAIFEGWREMDAYMRDNNIQGMPFQPAAGEAASAQAAGKSEEAAGNDPKHKDGAKKN